MNIRKTAAGGMREQGRQRKRSKVRSKGGTEGAEKVNRYFSRFPCRRVCAFASTKH